MDILKWRLLKRIFSILLLLTANNAVAYEQPELSRKIFFMRERNTFCSLMGMKIEINDSSTYQLKNGDRMVLSVNQEDTLKIVVLYPPDKNYKSKTYYIYPSDENNIYINLNYSGSANVWSFFDKSTLKFNINVDFIDANEGIKRFENKKLFKKKVFLTEYPIVRSIP